MGGIERKTHRRHDKGVEGDRKWPAPKLTLSTEDQVEHLNRFIDVLGLKERGGDRLGGTRHRGIGRAEIEFPRVGAVTRNHRPTKEMEVLQGIGQAREVVQVGRR